MSFEHDGCEWCIKIIMSSLDPDERDFGHLEGHITYEIEFGENINKIQGILTKFPDLVHHKDWADFLPIHHCAKNGKHKIMKMLIDEFGSNIDDIADSMSPLLIAACYGKLDCIALLMNRGANLIIKDHNGYNYISHLKHFYKNLNKIFEIL